MAILEGKPYWRWTRWMNDWKGKNKLPYTLPDNHVNANFYHELFFQPIYLLNYVKVANFPYAHSYYLNYLIFLWFIQFKSQSKINQEREHGERKSFPSLKCERTPLVNALLNEVQ